MDTENNHACNQIDHEDGVGIPEFLSPFLGGMTFLPYADNNVPPVLQRGNKDKQSNSSKNTTSTTSHSATTNSTACSDDDDDNDGGSGSSEETMKEVKQKLESEMKGVDDDMELLRQHTDELNEVRRKLSRYYVSLDQLKQKIELLELKKVVLATTKDSLEGSIDNKLRRAERLREKLLVRAVSNFAEGEVDDCIAASNSSESDEHDDVESSAVGGSSSVVAIATHENGKDLLQVDGSATTVRSEVMHVAVNSPHVVNMAENGCTVKNNDNDDDQFAGDKKESSSLEESSNNDDPLPPPDLDLYNFHESSMSPDSRLPSESPTLEEREVSFCLKVGDLDLGDLDDVGLHVELNRRDIDCALFCAILSKLVERGLKHTHLDDRKIWKPSKETDKLIRKNKLTALGSEILVWSGHPSDFSTGKKTNGFKDNMYGTDLPIVRARGMVQIEPKRLLDLLLDNDRVKSYNEMSLGRSDELVLQTGVDTIGPFGVGQSIVVRSLSKPPLVRKPLEFINMMHARSLYPSQGEGKGYLIVTRGVEESSSFLKSKSLGNQILFSFNLLREVTVAENNFTWTELTTISHINIANVPSFLATSVGMKSATSFIADVRKACAEAASS